MFSKFLQPHLYDQSSQYNGAEDWIVEDALKDVSLAVNFTGVQLIKDLHEDEGVEDDGVVLRRWAVKGGVPPAVNVKHFFTCEWKGQTLLSGWLYLRIIESFIHPNLQTSAVRRLTNEKKYKDGRQLVDSVSQDVLHHCAGNERFLAAIRVPEQQGLGRRLRGQSQ